MFPNLSIERNPLPGGRDLPKRLSDLDDAVRGLNPEFCSSAHLRGHCRRGSGSRGPLSRNRRAALQFSIYEGKRRVAWHGWQLDFSDRKPKLVEPMPKFLVPLPKR